MENQINSQNYQGLSNQQTGSQPSNKLSVYKSSTILLTLLGFFMGVGIFYSRVFFLDINDSLRWLFLLIPLLYLYLLYKNRNSFDVINDGNKDGFGFLLNILFVLGLIGWTTIALFNLANLYPEGLLGLMILPAYGFYLLFISLPLYLLYPRELLLAKIAVIVLIISCVYQFVHIQPIFHLQLYSSNGWLKIAIIVIALALLIFKKQLGYLLNFLLVFACVLISLF